MQYYYLFLIWLLILTLFLIIYNYLLITSGTDIVYYY